MANLLRPLSCHQEKHASPLGGGGSVWRSALQKEPGLYVQVIKSSLLSERSLWPVYQLSNSESMQKDVLGLGSFLPQCNPSSSLNTCLH